MKKQHKSPCRTCQLDNIQASLLKGYPELQPVGPWKFGRLYRCSQCGRRWFLPDHEQVINRIQDDLLGLAEYWNAHSLTVSDVVLKDLAGIGGVLDFHRTQIAIPCCVELGSGQTIAKAVVVVSRQPPHFWFSPGEVHWAGEIQRVTVSPYALPQDVRLACEQKREEAFGFAPVGVVDPDGHEYTLVSKSPFFDWRGIQGKDLRLSGRKRNWRERVRPEAAEAYFFVDWFDDCAASLAKEAGG